MKSLLFIITLFAYTIVYAQKLPKVQTGSVRAPVNVKIDGKASEWGEMKAYNPSVEMFYTIANDDNKLYLVFRNKHQDLLPKLVNGGVTLLIQKSNKKSDNASVGLTFPYMDNNQKVGFGWNPTLEKERIHQ